MESQQKVSYNSLPEIVSGIQRLSKNFEVNREHNMSNLIKIIAVGDVMLGRLVDQLFKEHVHAPKDNNHAQHVLHNLGVSVCNASRLLQ